MKLTKEIKQRLDETIETYGMNYYDYDSDDDLMEIQVDYQKLCDNLPSLVKRVMNDTDINKIVLDMYESTDTVQHMHYIYLSFNFLFTDSFIRIGSVNNSTMNLRLFKGKTINSKIDKLKV